MFAYEIVSLGESLLDFVMLPKEGKGKIVMEGNAGGAPANVLAAATKLGRKTAYISRVGNDPFGMYFIENLREIGVEVSGVVIGVEPTTLAMVALDKQGDRTFRFYRNETADVRLSEGEVDMSLVASGKIFHFGSLSLTSEPIYSATLAAVKKAKEAGALISFDPNYRPALWKEEKQALEAMEEGAYLADFLKVSEEEASLLTKEKDAQKAAVQLLTKYNLKFVAVTLGEKGCVAISSKARISVPAYKVPVLDTTGAGDAFWGAALHGLLSLCDVDNIGEEELQNLLCFANAAGSLATTKYGAVPALATKEEIEGCMKHSAFLEG